MKSILKFVTLAGILTFVVGCVTTLHVTYHSDLPGAALYESGRFWGYTPITLQYPNAHIAMQAGQCQMLQPLTVRWASGAEASISNLQTCPVNGYNQQFSFIRPAEIPGREFDAQFALERERIAIMQQQATAQQTSALSSLFQALNQQTQQTYSPPPQQNVNCTTHVFGNTIQTRCR